MKNQGNNIFVFIVSQVGGIKFLEPLLLMWNKYNFNNYYILVKPEINKYLSKKIPPKKVFNCTKELKLSISSKNYKKKLIFISAATDPTSYIDRLAYKYSRIQKIKLIQFIDNWYDIYNRLFRTNGYKNYPDILLLPDNLCMKTAVQQMVPKDLIVIVGHPGFEKEETIRPKAPKRFLIIDQPLSEIKLNLGYNEFDFYNIVFKTLDLLNISYTEIDIVVHPSRKIKLCKKLPFKLTYIKGEVTQQYEFVLGIFSSLLIEEFYKGSNIISIQPILHDCDPFPLSAQKKIRRFSNSNDLGNYFETNNSINIKNKINPFLGSTSKLSNILLNYGI